MTSEIKPCIKKEYDILTSDSTTKTQQTEAKNFLIDNLPPHVFAEMEKCVNLLEKYMKEQTKIK